MNPVIQAIRSLDNYVRGNAQYTTTELVEPERILSLVNKHRGELREEVGVWTIMGSALHAVLKEAANFLDPERYITEKRFTATMPGGAIISSQIDVYDLEEKILENYKVCSVWKFILQDSPEWEQQLNIEACVMRANGFEIKHVRNVAFLRDWNIRKARTSRDADYPKTDIHEVDVPLWSMGQQQQFILERIAKHEAAKENPPVCSKKERWERDAKVALMRKGNKKAVKLYGNKQQAYVALDAIKRRAQPGRQYYLEERPVEPVRCLDYCPVRDFCDFGIQALEKWRHDNDGQE